MLITKAEINEKIKNYKYVHIMFNDKFNKPFVDFLNRNFDIKEHIVLCQRWYKEFSFPEGENVFEMINLEKLEIPDNIEKVIFHSLLGGEYAEYLYNHQDILKNKAYWVIWGGDLYDAPRNEIDDFVRANFKGYTDITDEEYAKKKYNIDKNKKFIDVNMIFPINSYILDNVKKLPHDYIKIQINNSCDKTILEMLDILSKFRNENIKITTILSYGQLEYKEEIIKKGKNIFGNKFEFVDKFLEPKDYAQYIAQNDILILNQNRQQGIGNTIAALYLGTKVFIKQKVSTNKYANQIGIKIYDTETITNINFNDFVQNNTSKHNKLAITPLLDEKTTKNKWKNLFEAK